MRGSSASKLLIGERDLKGNMALLVAVRIASIAYTSEGPFAGPIRVSSDSFPLFSALPGASKVLKLRILEDWGG
jgi:hypothetical protein